MASESMFQNSELAQAAYAGMHVGDTGDTLNLSELRREIGADMTFTQAEQFAARFVKVVAVSEDPLDTGFSATVFGYMGSEQKL